MIPPVPSRNGAKFTYGDWTGNSQGPDPRPRIPSDPIPQLPKTTPPRSANRSSLPAIIATSTTTPSAQKPATTRIPPIPSMPATIDEDDPMLDYSPETWIASMIGSSGLLYRFSESLVYKSNVSQREAEMMEAAGNVALRPLTRVIWKGSQSASGTKAVIMEFGKRFRPAEIASTRLRAVVVEMFVLVQNLHGKAGIVHGDIKPAKFLWGRDSRLKLADFSSARFIEESPDLWNASNVTEPYLTPDRMRRREETAVDGVEGTGTTPAPTVFDDYYALAITLWAICTGKKPVNHQFNQKNIRRSDLTEVHDDMIRRWIRKVFKMAGCRFW